MFIYSVKASTLKFIAILSVAVIILVSVILVSSGTDILTTKAIAEANKSIKYDKIKTEEDRIGFISQFGWEVEGGAVESVKVTLPGEFDRIMTEYNELQKSQGLDLSKYKGRDVERHTYKLKNYPDYDGDVLINILVYRNRVIGGDICSTDVSGFIHGFTLPSVGAK